jgi:glycerol transport system ATP-binding protein
MLVAPKAALKGLNAFTLGVRPEYVRLASPNEPGALPGVVTQAQDIGTYWLLTAGVGESASQSLLRARLSSEQTIPRVGETVWLSIVGEHTCYYVNEELIA